MADEKEKGMTNMNDKLQYKKSTCVCLRSEKANTLANVYPNRFATIAVVTQSVTFTQLSGTNWPNKMRRKDINTSEGHHMDHCPPIHQLINI
ncbi:hypothetical protein AVEN_167915-1 [Araneus ventricosus]|uniref:Uncharacterized protein n=1 Tax=Araneus ventricosus TaxID=182803 RepID=A0A4Y2FVA2_ARAVE|nr:hypothetical protein AVEN_167915-1 [Araneus ventricosus]